MMMPANFSAVNAEVVYGGAVTDYLPDAWTSKNFKTLSTNIVTILSNTFTSKLVAATLGTMFSGNWGEDGVKLFGDQGTFSALYHIDHDITKDSQNFGNKIMTTLGLASAVYTLGTTSAAVFTVKNVANIKGQTLVDGVWTPTV